MRPKKIKAGRFVKMKIAWITLGLVFVLFLFWRHFGNALSNNNEMFLSCRQLALDNISHKDWNNDQEITIRGTELTKYIDSKPVQGFNANTYSIGMWIDDKPRDFALQNAELVSAFARSFEKARGRRIGFDLKFFNPQLPMVETIVQGKADLFILDAAVCVNALAKSPEIIPLAYADGNKPYVIFVNRKSGIEQIADLRGKSLLFQKSQSSATIWAKKKLFEQGLTRSGFKSISYLHEIPNVFKPEVLAKEHLKLIPEVYEGRFDAGVLEAKHVATRLSVGLVPLTTFTNSPVILVARRGLPHDVIKAMRKAVVSLPKHLHGDLSSDSVGILIPFKPVFLDDLRAAMKLAEKFDAGE